MNHLLDLWSAWTRGPLPQEGVHWGFTVLEWGRIGKLMQFAGALTVVVDIVGPHRIRQFGTSLRPVITIAKMKERYSRERGYMSLIRDLRAAKREDEQDRLEAEQLRYAAGKFEMSLGCTALAVCVWVIWTHFHPIIAMLATIPSLVIVGLAFHWIGPLLGLAFAYSMLALGVFFDCIVVEPIAWALSQRQLEILIRCTALLLLLLGFHFDLLADA